MVIREFWRSRLEAAWRRKNVVWLAGVRRAGKTVLAQSLRDVEFLECESPQDRRRLEDPDAFLASVHGKRIVLDEIHRLPNPSELLKLAADHHPTVRLLATGSSTLTASTRFRDTLVGRKANVWLTPMTLADVGAFRPSSLERRMLHGGLPGFYLAGRPPREEVTDWMDGYWAKDLTELFRFERKWSVQRFVELLLANSGGMFEATRYTTPCEVSRASIHNYLRALEDTFVAHVLRPYTTRRTAEIVSAPKVYMFDTGFIAAARGWKDLRPDDRGGLWEHLVLNELHARLATREIRYWRDKQRHEVDFVVARPGEPPVAIEAKWSAGGFDPAAFAVFAGFYPMAALRVVCADVPKPFDRRDGSRLIRFTNPDALCDELTGA
jgi:hypothetical protein